MKKITFIFASVLIAGLGFTSCSSDDDSNDSNSIVAKWNYNRIKTSVNGQLLSDEPYQDNEPGCEKDYLDIKDNNLAEFGDYYAGEMNEGDCELITQITTYYRNGNTMTVIVDAAGETETIQVISVNQTSMELRFTETHEGVTGTYDISFIKAS